MLQWDIPSNWGLIRLGDVAPEVSSQVTPKNETNTTFNYWSLDAISQGQMDEPQPNYVLGSTISSTCVSFTSEHVLYAKLRPYLNKVIVPSVNGIGSTEWVVLAPNPSLLDRKYLGYVLRTNDFVKHMTDSSAGARMPRARKDILFDSQIPIPFPNDPARSLETQKRIILRLETLLGEVKSARELQESIEEDTGQLLTSVLWSIFPDPEKDMPEGWQVKTVEEISDNPQYGYTQSATQEPVGPKFLRITDIQDGRVDWSNVPYCQIETRALERYRLKDNDLVFARTGATTGKTFLIKNPPEAVFASYLIRLRIVEGALPEFIYWYFQSPYYWKQITPRGGAMPNMNAQLLKQVRVSLPTSIDLQRSIIDKIELYAEEVRSLKSGQNESTELIAQLEQSLLAQAFRGEL